MNASYMNNLDLHSVPAVNVFLQFPERHAKCILLCVNCALLTQVHVGLVGLPDWAGNLAQSGNTAGGAFCFLFLDFTLNVCMVF